MKMKAFGLMFLFLVGILASVVPATAIPQDIIKEVKVEGTVLNPADTTRLDLERGQSIDVRITLESAEDLSGIEVEAFISGYEYNDKEPISATTHIFDMDAGVTYVKSLKLTLPDKMDGDNYKIRIMATDRYGQEVIKSYNIKVDVPRHSLVIKDVAFSPEDRVQGGKALLSTVRIKNMGDQTEDSIKIKVSIPDLGISATDFIDELDADESATSEEIYLRIPTCAKPGDYDVVVSVMYDEGYEKVSVTKTIEVTSDETCQPAPSTTEEKTFITYGPETQAVTKGTEGVVYAVTISNQGTAAKTFSVTTDGTDWATVTFSPSNLVVLDAGETKTVFIKTVAKDDAAAGEHMFAVSVKDASGKTLKQLTLKSTVVEGGLFAGSMSRNVTIGLAVLLILLVIVALIIIFNRMRGSDDEDEEGKTYY